MGQSPSSENYTEDSRDTVLIQGNADLINGKVVPRIFTSEITKLSYPGDIILTVRAPVGDLAINEFKSCIGRGVCSIKGNKFIYYFLQSLKDKHVWERLSQGSTFESINSNDIKNLNLKIPSKTTQESISDFLTLIDAKIELLEKKHESYIDFKKYLIQQIFAQKLRFKINSSYSNFKLKDIVTKFSTGLNPRKNFKLNEGGENFYVTIKNFQNGILNLDDKCDKIDDDALKLINKRSDLQKDDLIFASIGRVGEVYLIKNNPLNWNINESVFSLRPNKQFIEPKFLYYLLNSNKIQNYFESNITGSTFKSIKMKDLKNTPVTIPDSFELQNEIINCYP